MTDVHDRIDALSGRVDDARRELADLIRSACPGPHKPAQHRDRRPPWCEACGYTDSGVQVRWRQPEPQPVSPVGANAGHGYAWERPDGVKARCGGPGLCAQCRADEQLVKAREGAER